MCICLCLVYNIYMINKSINVFIIFSVLLLTSILFYSTQALGIKYVTAESNSMTSTDTGAKKVDLYVYPIKLNKAPVVVGGDVSGTFTLSNIGNDNLQDSYYVLSLNNESGVPLGESPRFSIPYVKENSKRDIDFSYAVPTTVSGNVDLIITIYLQNGTVITTGSQNMYVRGEPQFKITIPSEINIFRNGIVYDKDYGLVLEKNDKLSISYRLDSVNTSSTSIEVYDVDSNIVANLPVRATLNKQNKSGKYELNIPTDELTPGKYSAKIKFNNDDSYSHPINPISVNFIVGGLSSSITAIKSDHFSLSKNEKFNLTVNYDGYGKTEDLEINSRMSGAILFLSVKNEDDVEILSATLPVDLSLYNNSIVIPAKSKYKAEYLNISAEIRDNAGVVIDSYSSTLPSEEEVNILYPEKKSDGLMYYVLVILIFIATLMIVSFIRNKRKNMSSVKNSKKKIRVSMFIIFSLFLSSCNTALAFSSSDVVSTGDVSLASSFAISGVSSPLPSAISFYTPGDSFNVSLLVNKNSASTYSIYYLLPPDQNSWNNWDVPNISINQMTLSNSVNVSSNRNYNVSNVPGSYNFTFYVAIADSAKRNVVIKKVTQPILVLLPSNQLIGDLGTLAYAGQSEPQALSCDNSHKEGEKICDSGTPAVWNCESTIGACTMDSTPVAGGLIISGGKAASGSSLDVSANMPGIVSGNRFYVITDLQNSDWVDKEYAYSEFIFGTAKTVVYQPYTRKSNKHTVYYDGANSVVATSQYVGKSSKFTNASVTIKEVGSLSNSAACRNIPESEMNIMFNKPNNLISVPLCTYPKYTKFSNGINSYVTASRASGGNNSRGRTASLSMNICQYMPSLNNGDQFYVLIDSNGTSWLNTRYDLFNFSKGTPKTSTFSAPSKKYNVISGSYDGVCTVNFSSRHAGKKSDYTAAQMDIIELGPWNNKMCYYSTTPYSWNFNRGNWVPPLPQCQGSNDVTCTTGEASWKLNQDTGACTNLLSCIFKNNAGDIIYNIPVGESFRFDANFATSGNSSLLSYSWSFGDGASPNSAYTKNGSLSYDSPGEKVAELQVALDNTVLEQGQCPALSVNCPSGDCSNVSAGCGVSEVLDNQGLESGSTNLCPAMQTSTGFAVSSLITQSNPSVWSWVCKSSTNERKCSARCKAGLNYCSDTGKCSTSCKGDMCPYIDGIQSEDNPVYKIAKCVKPKLTMKLTFDKPYASETTSKCSVNWVPRSNLSDLSYTVCTLDGFGADNSVSEYPVTIGRHKLSCVTKVTDDENPSFSLSSDPYEINFKCDRVPNTTEN